MDHMAVSRVDRGMVKGMAVTLMGHRVTVATDNQLQHKMVIPNLHNRATKATPDRSHLGMATSRLLVMGSKVPTVARRKEMVVMDSKAPMVAAVEAAPAAAAMEDGVKVKVVVRVGGMDVTKETAQTEGALEAEAAVATTVAVMTAAVDLSAVATTVAEEEDLLVWEVVTVVATKITVDLETTAQGMNQLVSRTTLTTTPFLSRGWEKKPQFRKSATSSSRLVSSRSTKRPASQ